jgi:D-glycero-alpha-D-manno-heptose-7-phosphate kinase
MIISRTPFRISFFGGGTDYPGWYRKHGGSVLSASIDKYCYLTCRYLPPFFEHRIRVAYSKIELCQTIDEIVHPAVRESLRFLKVTRGVEIHHDGDLPARSGMGSSSSFTVGLLHALHALHGRMVSKHQLATEGIHVEQELLKESVGSQDQVCAAYGGLNHIRFFQTGEITVHPVLIGPERRSELDSHLMLFYTGMMRSASEIADSFVHDLESRRRQLRIMQDLVDEAIDVLNGTGDIAEFGSLLHESWMAKRTLSDKISNSAIDEMYATARRAGALGGKLLGAGGGGFLLVFAPPELHENIKAELHGLIHVPFRFEPHGSQIVFFDQETDYATEDNARTLSMKPIFKSVPERPLLV